MTSLSPLESQKAKKGIGYSSRRVISIPPSYTAKKSAPGKKIGREAVAGVYTWAVNNPEFDYFIYPAHKDNIPSRKIAESLGGVVVSSGKKVFPTGKEFDEVVYHIPRERSPK
jgi:hypothetical protein